MGTVICAVIYVVIYAAYCWLKHCCVACEEGTSENFCRKRERISVNKWADGRGVRARRCCMFWEVVPVLLSKNGKVTPAKIIQCSSKHNTICMHHSQSCLSVSTIPVVVCCFPWFFSLLNATKKPLY